MNMAEILRKIADLMDQDSGQNRLEPVDVDAPGDEEQPKMVPPLQAKIEILKKSEGLPNTYDEDQGNDELSAIKKNAGLTAAQHEAAEDEPFDG